MVFKARLNLVYSMFAIILQIPLKRFKVQFWARRNPNLYFGSIKKNQIQCREGGFIGLSLNPRHFSEIKCDISKDVFPFASKSVKYIQAEDVLEHIEFSDVPKVFDEVFRILKSGGVFRLSVPDCNSIVLQKRLIYDFEGRVLADPLTGSSVFYDPKSEKILVKHRSHGNSHLWFPTKNLIDELIQSSELRFCASIHYHHYSTSEGFFLVQNFPDLCMPVLRSPPNDMRANGLPISIIVDFTKETDVVSG